MKFGMREAIVSPIVFTGLLVALVSVDERVRDRFGNLLSGGGISPWTDRVADLGDALITAMRHQSLENAPLLVFTAVGAMLMVFMFRT